MVPRFLLHDTADMSFGGFSGKGKLSLWGRMLKGYRRRILLSGKPPVPWRSTSTFWAPFQQISQQAQHLCAIGQKTAEKIHHAEIMLQLFDVLSGVGGGGQDSISAV
jgi:hypothetical protein